MTRGWVIVALLSHWRRNPWQAATLIIGLAIATALFAGVQALNFQARESYAQAASQLGANALSSLVSKDGDGIPQADFVKLRRAGWRVSPVVEGRIRLDEQRITVIGVDLATLPSAASNGVFERFRVADGSSAAPSLQPADFLLPPSRGLIAETTAAALNAQSNDRLQTDIGVAAPPLFIVDGIAHGVMFTDIGIAQRLMQSEGRISRLVIDKQNEARLPPIGDILETPLLRVEPAETTDISRLTKSFHLNLTAFGFLSFLVGLLIVHSAIGLAFEQRRSMFRTLRACGVSQRRLLISLLCETLLIAIVAGAIGLAAGYLIAAALLPDVSLTLQSLYGASVPGALSIKPIWWVQGLAMSIAGAALAATASLIRASRMPVLAPAQPEAWRAAERRGLVWKAVASSLAFALAAIFAAFGGGLVAGFLLMGSMLVGAALLLPVILSMVLGVGARWARTPTAQWFWADGRQQLPAITLALQALLIALAVNIGVGAMVASFRDTFTGWLDQRLAAELYVNAPDEIADDVATWLNARDEVTAVLPATFVSTRYDGTPIRVMGITVHDTYRDHWPLLRRRDDAWARLETGDGVLVNEQFARHHALSPGDEIEIDTPAGAKVFDVSAIYSDYGNTRHEIMMSISDVRVRWRALPVRLFLVRTHPEDVATVAAALTTTFAFDENNLIDQRALKELSHTIFERTFSVTAALNVLTLIVAGVALLTSLMTLSRSRLPQLAPLWAMGMTRARLSLLDFVKTLAFAFLTGVLAIPLGVALAWLLTDVINVAAFGWKLPLKQYPGEWLRLIGMAIITAAAASAPAAFALRRVAPAKLLKVFADAR